MSAQKLKPTHTRYRPRISVRLLQDFPTLGRAGTSIPPSLPHWNPQFTDPKKKHRRRNNTLPRRSTELAHTTTKRRNTKRNTNTHKTTTETKYTKQAVREPEN